MSVIIYSLSRLPRGSSPGKDTNILKNASKMASGKAVSANFGGPYLETPAADRDVRGRFPAYLEVDKKLRYFFPRSLHAIISPKSAGY